MQDDLISLALGLSRGIRLLGGGKLVLFDPVMQNGCNSDSQVLCLLPTAVCQWRVVWSGRR